MPLDADLAEEACDRTGQVLDRETLVDNPDVWRQELSERVEKFRLRRARLHDSDANGSLELDFEPAADADRASLDPHQGVEFPTASEEPESAAEGPEARGSGVSRPLGVLGSAARRPELPDQDWSLNHLAPANEPFGVILGDEPWGTETAPEPESIFRPAPLGRRCIAGLVDALMLLLGGGVFSLIFWAVGGQVSRNPVTLAVMGFIGVLFVLVYFASFIALTTSTPGLLAMNLEIRTLDGQSPTPSDAALRAFGYLVSSGALMLGFIWALVDSDGLTWHDRMSGTFVSEREPAVED